MQRSSTSPSMLWNLSERQFLPSSVTLLAVWYAVLSQLEVFCQGIMEFQSLFQQLSSLIPDSCSAPNYMPLCRKDGRVQSCWKQTWQLLQKRKRKKENGLSQRGCSSEIPTRAGCSVVLNHPDKTVSPKNHSFTPLALQEVPLLHATIWFPCRAL